MIKKANWQGNDWDHKKWSTIGHLKANELLKKLKNKSYIIYNTSADKWLSVYSGKYNLPTFIVFHERNSSTSSVRDTLQFKEGHTWYNYYIDKTEIHDLNWEKKEPDVALAASIFSRMVHPPHYPNLMNSIAQYQFPNDSEPLKPNLLNKTHPNCYGYDRHKAFLGAIIYMNSNNLTPLDLVDMRRPARDGEVGFNDNGIPQYGPTKFNCKYILSIGHMDGLENWCNYILDKLNSAKSKEEIAYIKSSIVTAIGNLANRDFPEKNNKFLRNCIVYWNNERTKKDKDENTLYCNTDSIVSLVPRPDLDMGPNPGQYDLEHFGDFRITDQRHYQWNEGHVKATNDNLQKYWEKAHGRKFILGVDDYSEFFQYFPIKYDEDKEQYVEKEI